MYQKPTIHAAWFEQGNWLAPYSFREESNISKCRKLKGLGPADFLQRTKKHTRINWEMDLITSLEIGTNQALPKHINEPNEQLYLLLLTSVLPQGLFIIQIFQPETQIRDRGGRTGNYLLLFKPQDFCTWTYLFFESKHFCALSFMKLWFS